MNEQLPATLLWAEGGHASDVVLAALADGQHAIVPADVRAHVEQCATCSAQLGHAALLSLEAHRALAAPARVRRIPRAAIALGLAAAVLGLVPSWLFGGSGAVAAPARQLSSATRGLATLSARLDGSSSSTLGLIATYVAAACLVFAGLALARLSSKKEVSQ
ncbi:MAG: hypothetical protein U0270_36635 [Labilithrix sp.]